MIYTTKELLQSGETEYSVRNKISNGLLFMVERGLYSDNSNFVIDEIFISKKYPFAILTGITAFYIYNLTDYVPEHFYLATEQHSFPIKRKDVKQSYQDPAFFKIGLIEMQIDNGGAIRIYDLERILIELIRLKEKYPKELYYEVLNSFRKIKDKIDFYKINQYLKSFSNGENILLKIKEVI